MDRPPRSPKARLLAMPRLLHAYAFLGIAEAALALAAFFWTYLVAGWRPGLPMAATGPLYRRATTMTLAGIVAAQVGNIFACRTERESLWRVGFLSNRMILASVLGEIGILAILILVPPFPSIFGLESLRFAEWRILLAFPLVMLLLEEGRKCAVRRWIRSREGEGRRHPSKG
jgi:magnesium-transporting ATPase (P-type)